MVLFAVIATKDIEFLVIEGGGVIFYLRSTEAFVVASLTAHIVYVLTRLAAHHRVHWRLCTSVIVAVTCCEYPL